MFLVIFFALSLLVSAAPLQPRGYGKQCPAASQKTLPSSSVILPLSSVTSGINYSQMSTSTLNPSSTSGVPLSSTSNGQLPSSTLNPPSSSGKPASSTSKPLASSTHNSSSSTSSAPTPPSSTCSPFQIQILKNGYQLVISYQDGYMNGAPFLNNDLFWYPVDGNFSHSQLSQNRIGRNVYPVKFCTNSSLINGLVSPLIATNIKRGGKDFGNMYVNMKGTSTSQYVFPKDFVSSSNQIFTFVKNGAGYEIETQNGGYLNESENGGLDTGSSKKVLEIVYYVLDPK